ncbi:MAG: hypothetical protein L3K19_02865 [Thermoplasmata archaeon]|nr:hypothetical protein [Thermoplasmata archaeon]
MTPEELGRGTSTAGGMRAARPETNRPPRPASTPAAKSRNAELPAKGPSGKAARRARRRRRKLIFGSLIAVFIAAAAILGVWVYWTMFRANPDPGTVSSGPPAGGNNTTYIPPTPVTLVPAGSQYTLAPKEHQQTPFVLNNTSEITGHVSGTPGVNVLIMTESQYGRFVNGSAPSSVWSSGSVQSAAIQTTLHPGSYEIVFLNPSTTQPALVHVLAPITAVKG